MKKLPILVLVTALLLYACKQPQKPEKPVFVATKTFVAPLLSYRLFATNTKGEETFCTYYSEAQKMFLGFGVNNQRRIFSFKLPEALKNEENNGSVESFFVHNFDSIFVLQTYRLSLIDTSGHVKFTKPVNTLVNEMLPDTVYGNFGLGFPAYYQPGRKQLFVMQFTGKYNFQEKEFFQFPVEAAYSLQDTQFTSLPVHFPKMLTQAFYGEVSNAFRAVNGNLHVYSFAPDSKLYTYDISSGRQAFYDCKSYFDTVPIKPLPIEAIDDMNRKTDHLLFSPLYFNILYDKYRNCYYRLFYKPMQLKKSDGTYNTWDKKENSLIVLDCHFNIIKEYDLGISYEWYYPIIAKDGLHLLRSRNDEKATTTFVFDVLRPDY